MTIRHVFRLLLLLPWVILLIYWIIGAFKTHADPRKGVVSPPGTWL